MCTSMLVGGKVTVFSLDDPKSPWPESEDSSGQVVLRTAAKNPCRMGKKFARTWEWPKGSEDRCVCVLFPSAGMRSGTTRVTMEEGFQPLVPDAERKAVALLGVKPRVGECSLGFFEGFKGKVTHAFKGTLTYA